MPVQRPTDFRNTQQYGTPNTIRGLARVNTIYTEYFDKAGKLQKMLLLEHTVADGSREYLQLEGADRAMKRASDDLVAEVTKRLAPRAPSPGTEVQEMVGELKVNPPAPGAV